MHFVTLKEHLLVSTTNLLCLPLLFTDYWESCFQQQSEKPIQQNNTFPNLWGGWIRCSNALQFFLASCVSAECWCKSPPVEVSCHSITLPNWYEIFYFASLALIYKEKTIKKQFNHKCKVPYQHVWLQTKDSIALRTPYVSIWIRKHLFLSVPL